MTELKKKSAWLIHGGRDNMFVDRSLDEGIIILGWDNTGDISGMPKAEIKTHVENNSAASMLENFRDRIKIGDVAVMRNKEKGKVAVGIICGDYQWLGDDAPPGKHVRKIEWKNQDFPIADFSAEEIRNRFYMPNSTLSRFRTDNAASRILESLQGRKHMDDKEMDGEIGGYIRLLQRFHQIILQGPPGTGKTYTAKKIIARLIGDVFDKAQGKRWDIVQFHPSYNYEDFVRGIQIQTEGGQVVYNSVNRILAEMAERAAKSEYPHALIIDEINRANVASVLGELIYALEYRGEAVKTPYAVDDSSDINLPENLYIIGTMNTADRTIGHLDYAVRRRFAFQTLLPNRDIVSRVSEAEDAAQWFDRVADFFQKDGGYLSPDFYREDVAVGHSYFLADDDSKLRDKIRYQVIPILSEYLKDGVLLPEAAEKIEELSRLLSAEIPEKNDGRGKPNPSTTKLFVWRHIDHGTSSKDGNPPGVGRLVLHIVMDYVLYESPVSIVKVREAFPVTGIVEEKNSEKVRKYSRKEGYSHNSYFIQPDEIIRLSDGTEMVVSREWGATGQSKPYFDKFCTAAEKLGYLIEEVDE